jgi:arginyl-tRNA synthetase
MVVSKDGSKFKSREGNAADADDIIESVVEEAKNQTIEHGKSEEMGTVELDQLAETIGIGALRFAMLRVNPKKKILFDPRESIDIHGDTSTFVQYSYARTNSILRKFKDHAAGAVVINNQEVKNLIMLHMQYGAAIKEAATQYDPSAIAQYAINLAKTFNRFYNEHSLLNEKDETIVASYLTIVQVTNQLIEKSLYLLGIESPERM